MKALFNTTIIMGAAQGLVIILELVRAKVVAVLIGPEGVGVLGNTLAFTSFWENLLLLGFHIALLRFASEKIKENSLDQVRLFFSTAIIVHLVVSAIGVGIAMVLLKQISISLYQTEAFSFVLAIVLLGIPFRLIRGDITNLFNAFNMVKIMALITVLTTLVTLVVLVPLIMWLSVRGAILSVFARSVVMFIIALFLYHRYLKPKLGTTRFTFSKTHALPMLKFGGTNQIAILLNTFSAYFMRILVTARLLLGGAGLFNAAMSMGSHVLLLRSPLGVYYYPKISGIYKDQQATVAEVNDVLRFYIILFTPVVVVILVLADPIIRLLLTAEFLPVIGILGWIMAARFFELIQSIFNIPVFIMGKYRIYLSINLIFNVVLLAGTYWLLSQFELLGAGIAQLISYALLCVLSYAAARKVFGLRISSTNWMLILSSLGLMSLAAYSGQQGWIFRAIPAVAVLVWLLVVVRSQEWLWLWRRFQAEAAKVTRVFRGKGDK